MEELKKVKCKKDFGVWYYRKINPTIYNDLDFPMYELYDENKKHILNFAYYDDMKCYIETGIII